MSNEDKPTLCSLPPELVYKIFDYLDARTIARSLRCVCKDLYKLVNSYDQFIFDFNSILKCDFLFLCNYIKHDKVVSLTLCDNDETPGQVQYFLSLFRIKQFTQLHCLNLIEIDDCYLKVILKDIKSSLLNSLTIHSERDYSQNNTNSEDFSSVISLSSLRKFDLNISSFNVSQIIWPLECSIQHLEINCRTLNEYHNIVRHLPNLRIFVVRQLDEQIHDGMITKPDDLEGFRQLSRLTLKCCNIDMFIFELILLLTPSIEHLQLIRCVELDIFTSYLPQWEKFVKKNLLLLNKFEFFLVDHRIFFNATPVDTESVINPFRTSFWIETKKWFVICDYIISPRTIIVYTPSFFDPQFEYVYQSKQISRSTTSSTINNSIVMDGVRKIHLNLESVMSSATSIQGGGLPRTVVFPNVDEVTLRIGNEWPLGSLRFLSTLIDLSHLVKLTLKISNSFNLRSESADNIDKLLKLMANIRSIKTLTSSGYVNTNEYNMKICSLLNNNVRHLTLSVSTVDQMRMVLRQLKYRSSIRFEYINNSIDASEMHLTWLEHEKGYYTYRLNDSSISMWFDNHINI